MAALGAAQLIAFWPVWRWCAVRAADTPEGLWSLLPLAVLLLLLFGTKPSPGLVRHRLQLPTVLLLLYSGSYWFVPPLIRAAIAMLALSSWASALWRGRVIDFGIAGLLFVSLPVVTTLQVYVGFQLRLVATHLTAPVLRLAGFPVLAEGTSLNWAGNTVLVDAPCSGIKMLWAGFFLTFALASFLRLDNARCLIAVLGTFVVVVLGNVFRAVGLFYLESRIIEGPGWAHDAMGALAFVLTALLLVALITVLERIRRCVRSTCSLAS